MKYLFFPPSFLQFNLRFTKTREVYKIMWQKYGRAGQATDGYIIWRMRIACWIPKTIKTFSEYVILIVFPLQQWFHERASPYVYTYSASLVHLCSNIQKSFYRSTKKSSYKFGALNKLFSLQ